MLGGAKDCGAQVVYEVNMGARPLAERELHQSCILFVSDNLLLLETVFLLSLSLFAVAGTSKRIFPKGLAAIHLSSHLTSPLFFQIIKLYPLQHYDLLLERPV